MQLALPVFQVWAWRVQTVQTPRECDGNDQTRFNVIGPEKGIMTHERQREHCFFGILDSLRRRD
jgi:hypothetical protein